jgi:hypothetical protein
MNESTLETTIELHNQVSIDFQELVYWMTLGSFNSMIMEHSLSHHMKEVHPLKHPSHT